jgi:hypothetical protein
MQTKINIGYQLRLLAFATLISTGVTSVVASYVPEQEIKQILRHGKRLRVRRIDCMEDDPE